MALVERVVQHALFEFTNSQGQRQVAMRGATIQVGDDDLERGELYGVFEADQDEADVESNPVAEEPTGPETSPPGAVPPEGPAEEPASADERPPKAAPKESWVDYAVSLRPDDQSEADARAAAQAMTKQELIDKYGA